VPYTHSFPDQEGISANYSLTAPGITEIPGLTHILEGDIHPNDRGYREIARALEEALPD
jgi:lysophospholipase L1-like esterase